MAAIEIQPTLVHNASSDSNHIGKDLSLPQEILNDTKEMNININIDANNCNSRSPSLTTSNSNSSSTSCSIIVIDGGTPESELVDIEMSFPLTPTPRDHENKTNTNMDFPKPKLKRTGYDIYGEPNENRKLTHHSPSKSLSASISQCRYCYHDIHRESNLSKCHCTSRLCEECFRKEILLTYNRSGHNYKPHCTVCQYHYEIDTQFDFQFKRDCLKNRFFECCGLRHEQYLLEGIGGKIGYFLVILGINCWVVATMVLFSFPPNGLPIYLYWIIAVFDLIVGVSTIWLAIKCRFLTPILLSAFYLLRCLYLLLGWIPTINILSINMYKSFHINIMACFIAFSFITWLLLIAIAITDCSQQIIGYKMKNQTVVINGVEINLNNINMNQNQNQNQNNIENQENDQF